MRIHSTWSENCITIYPARIRKAMPSLQRRRRVRRRRWRNPGRRTQSKSRREFMTAVASKRTLGIFKLASWAFHCHRGQIPSSPRRAIRPLKFGVGHEEENESFDKASDGGNESPAEEQVYNAPSWLVEIEPMNANATKQHCQQNSHRAVFGRSDQLWGRAFAPHGSRRARHSSGKPLRWSEICLLHSRQLTSAI